ncbi:MAG: glycoside hydrolase 43 family protein [Duncaniella sp.]|uniref:glycoside hydrolase family 43 protein n=1 Tax=Duncaniella sp. TaxID=2518496 RepID=UPI0023D25DB8|nr:glycoside hydrolase 43 family protein [Duncaniella sp.]MDE5988162.1 glycoside hydrolase 43 family protein [Duncaniella sp.]
MKTYLSSLLITFLLPLTALAGTSTDSAGSPRWGDLGDGTFANPVLNSDYSDPDIIRVGDRFYMTCSEFHFMGMPVLESADMVNWRVIGRVFDRIDLPGYSDMTKYAEGTWAPALRYHDGKFYIFVCTPYEGLFMTTATDPAGPWEPLHLVKGIEKWEDPCPFWDDNGDAYLVRSRHRAGPIIIHRMSPDGRSLLDEGTTVYKGPVAEGPKMFKKDGYYYISIPEGGVSTGWQTILRSKEVYGPYEARRVLEKGSTDINGPHQGALVDTPDGKQWWFYHFQNAGTRGRVVHLQPVEWRDGFPEIGTDYDGNGVGEPMKICPKPSVAAVCNPSAPQTSDDFSTAGPALQWQFNHNPDTAFYSIDTRRKCLKIMPQPADILRNAKNQLTQRLTGYRSEATVTLDFSAMKPGERAGIECIGKQFHGAGIMVGGTADNPLVMLYAESDSSVVFRQPLHEVAGVSMPRQIRLRLMADTESDIFRFFYSLDGTDFRPLGETFSIQAGFWKGIRPGLFAYSASSSAGQQATEPGVACFSDFVYLHDGPGGKL